jgi:hypothetical protein
MQSLSEIVSDYVQETRRLEALPSSTETTFYPDLKTLLNAVLRSARLPFDVITGTSEGGSRRRDMPWISFSAIRRFSLESTERLFPGRYCTLVRGVSDSGSSD